MFIETLLGAVQSPPVPSGRDQQMDAIQYVALALMVLSLGAVLVIVVLARAVARQRRRLIEMQNAQKPSFSGPDPWLEAARRVPVPSATELAEQMNTPPATPPPPRRADRRPGTIDGGRHPRGERPPSRFIPALTGAEG